MEHTMPPVLAGTLPVMPFHPAQLVGAVQSDGQRPRVAALACEPDGLAICLSLVGPANSVSSALAKLMDPNGRLFFEPADGVAWDEPRILRRETGVAYKELTVRLRGTLEAHGLALPLSAHLGDGLAHPPVIPQEEPPTSEPDSLHEAPTGIAETPALPLDPMTRLRAVLAKARPRYLFGNWAEETPNRRAFLGVLRGLRAIFITAPPGAEPGFTAAMHQWADALWAEGRTRELITPLPSIGIRCWRLSGDLARWSDLISDGVRERWLIQA
jgi:hypothetical protein